MDFTASPKAVPLLQEIICKLLTIARHVTGPLIFAIVFAFYVCSTNSDDSCIRCSAFGCIMTSLKFADLLQIKVLRLNFCVLFDLWISFHLQIYMMLLRHSRVMLGLVWIDAYYSVLSTFGLVSGHITTVMDNCDCWCPTVDVVWT